jgi:serine/threonine protein kinase
LIPKKLNYIIIEFLSGLYKQYNPDKIYPGFVESIIELKNEKIDIEIYNYLSFVAKFPINFFLERYILIKTLGDEEAKVYKVKKLSNDKIIIVKIIPKDLVSELQVMKELSKPNCNPFIACLQNYFYDENSQTYILEIDYIEGKTFKDFFDELKKRETNEKFFTFLLSALKDISCILSFIHSKGIIHGDLHVENIMIDNKNNPIIIDFGTSCFEKECDMKNTKAYDVSRLGETFYFISTNQIYHFDSTPLNISNKKLEKIMNMMLGGSISAKQICESI